MFHSAGCGYQPYLEVLENSKSSADSEMETSETDSPEEEKTGKETQQKNSIRSLIQRNGYSLVNESLKIYRCGL